MSVETIDKQVEVKSPPRPLNEDECRAEYLKAVADLREAQDRERTCEHLLYEAKVALDAAEIKQRQAQSRFLASVRS